jgi:hypothetical protein
MSVLFYDVRRWGGFMPHDILTEFHDVRFRYLSNITIITTIISEAVMFILLVEGIYELRLGDGFRCRYILPSFIKIGSGIQKLIQGGYTHTDNTVIL